MQQLAELVVELTGTKSPIVYEPLPTDDPKVRQPDITRARTMLGWEPKVHVRDGLARTIEYFQRARRHADDGAAHAAAASGPTAAG